MLPDTGTVSTAALLTVLAGLGIDEGAARQAVARTAADGWLTSERDGRRVRWALTPAGRRLLTEEGERLLSFGTPRPPWDGRWLVVTLSVPETSRALRRRLRAKMGEMGFGSPAAGIWINHDSSRAAEAAAAIRGLGLERDAMSFHGAFGDIGSQRAMAERAWDLGEVADRYRAFLDAFSHPSESREHGALLRQIRLVHEWRRFPAVDPRLPAEFLPSGWPGAVAAALFADLHRQWQPSALAAWAELSANPGA